MSSPSSVMSHKPTYFYPCLLKKKANHGRIIPFFQPLMVARPGNHRNFLQLYPKMRNQRLDSWNIWIIHVKKEIKKSQTISSPIFRGISATKLDWENPAACFLIPWSKQIMDFRLGNFQSLEHIESYWPLPSRIPQVPFEDRFKKPGANDTQPFGIREDNPHHNPNQKELWQVKISQTWTQFQSSKQSHLFKKNNAPFSQKPFKLRQPQCTENGIVHRS